MKLGTAMMIFLLAILALVAEVVLYVMVGAGAALSAADSGEIAPVLGVAFFFVSLMVFTAAAGILAPLCALLELAVKKRNVGAYTMASTLALLLVGLAFFNTIGIEASSQAARESGIGDEPEAPAGTISAEVPAVAEREAQGKPKPEVAYLDQVIVRGTEVAKARLGDRGVFGEIKNTGNRSLDLVEITIYALDAASTPVFEKAYHPVLVNSYSYGDDAEPLKPNYSRKFGVRMDDAPSDWSGRVKVKVTEVEFSDDT